MKRVISILLTLFLVISFANDSYAINFGEAKIEKVTTELPKLNDVNVCVGDFGSHGETVSNYVSKYFEGSTKLIEYSSYEIYEDENCDVINHSVGSIPLFYGYSQSDREIMLKKFIADEFEKIDNFLSYHKGIIVESAGNNGEEAVTSSSIARYKLRNEGSEVNNRLFVIGQIEKTKDNKYIHHFNYGEEIDFVVANYNEYVKGERHSGTSFSTPVVSGVIATLLSAGIPQEDIRDVIGYEDNNHTYEGKQYKVFSVMKTYRNAYEYLEKNK